MLSRNITSGHQKTYDKRTLQTEKISPGCLSSSFLRPRLFSYQRHSTLAYGDDKIRRACTPLTSPICAPLMLASYAVAFSRLPSLEPRICIINTVSVQAETASEPGLRV